jgi:hypothetical protein
MPEADFISFPSSQIDEIPEHLCEPLRSRYSYVTSPSALPPIFTLSPCGRGQGEGDKKESGHWFYQVFDNSNTT